MFHRESGYQRRSGRPPAPGAGGEQAGLAAGITTIRRAETDRKLVALTFDDGPDQTQTPRNLKALQQSGAAATFFVLGKLVDQLPQVTQAIQAAGSEIANHSYDHPWLTRQGYAGVASQLGRTREAAARAGVTMTALFRPPYGAFDETVLGAAAGSGYRYNVLWDIDPSDYRQPPASTIISHVLANLRPGSIVVLHDWVRQTADALPGLLSALSARGYRAVTVSELLGAPAPAPEPPGPNPPGPNPPGPNPSDPPYQPSQCRTLQVRTPYLSGDDVRAVQNALGDRGWDPGTADGVYGPQTSAAVRRFQMSRGLRVTGVVGAEEYRQLGVRCPTYPPEPGPAPGPAECRRLSAVQPYPRGDDVRAVQHALTARGISPGPADGVYGPRTARAVGVFQTREGLTVNGVVDAEVYRRLGIRCPD